MPRSAPATKVAGVAHWGATVRLHGDSYDETKKFAADLASQNGWRLLPAFDDPDVIAGQGTVGLELAPLAPDVVLVPIGGGGLAAGVALALKSLRETGRTARRVRVVGAQVEGVDAMARVLRGDVTSREPAVTLADGVRVKEPGLLTRCVLADLLDDLVIVREAELRETLVRLALEEHVIAEGAGALALAAGRRVAGRRKCAIVSGGNLDAGVLAALLSDVRPRPLRRPRRRSREGDEEPALAPSACRDPSPPRMGVDRPRPARGRQLRDRRHLPQQCPAQWPAADRARRRHRRRADRTARHRAARRHRDTHAHPARWPRVRVSARCVLANLSARRRRYARLPAVAGRRDQRVRTPTRPSVRGDDP